MLLSKGSTRGFFPRAKHECRAGPCSLQGTELEGDVLDISLQCNKTAANCFLGFALSEWPNRPIACEGSSCSFADGELPSRSSLALASTAF